jgi:hypothetical protein
MAQNSAFHISVWAAHPQRDERRPTAFVGDCLQLRDPSRGRVADAQVQHLPGAHQVVERAQEFVRRRRLVPRVQVQQLDAVGAELAQALLDGVGMSNRAS